MVGYIHTDGASPVAGGVAVVRAFGDTAGFAAPSGHLVTHRELRLAFATSRIGQSVSRSCKSQPQLSKVAARSSETGSIDEGADHCYAASNGGSIVGMDVTDHAPTSNGVSFAACTTGRSTANSAAGSSGSAMFISFRLLEGEELLQSSPIPPSMVEVGDGVTRKWSFQDLASNTENNVAKIIAGGCFGEIIYNSRMHSTAAIDTPGSHLADVTGVGRIQTPNFGLSPVVDDQGVPSLSQGQIIISLSALPKWPLLGR